MSDYQHLLAAIAANRDDDLPRLVFADWLDEYPAFPPRDFREWAEFIRVQCAIARGTDHDTALTLDSRQHELFSGVLPHFGATILDRGDFEFGGEGWVGNDSRYRAFVRRGFVDELRGSLSELLKHGNKFARAFPIPAKVTVMDRSPRGEREWWLVRPEHDPDQSDLPAEVFERLRSGKRSERYSTSVRVYWNRGEAEEDLSSAVFSLLCRG